MLALEVSLEELEDVHPVTSISGRERKNGDRRGLRSRQGIVTEPGELVSQARGPDRNSPRLGHLLYLKQESNMSRLVS